MGEDTRFQPSSVVRTAIGTNGGGADGVLPGADTRNAGWGVHAAKGIEKSIIVLIPAANWRFQITVDWPEDLLNLEVTPATAFGNTLQALDDIRKRDEVFISLLPNSNKVEILGLDIMKIEAAEAHYKTLIERIRTEKCNLQQAMNMILDEREGIDVIMIRAETWWPDHNHIVVPRLLPSPMMDRPGNFRGDGLHELQLVDIRDYIKQALEAVSYKKGSYDFIVRLGCVALDTRMGEDHVGKKHGKEKFLNSINGKVELISKKW